MSELGPILGGALVGALAVLVRRARSGRVHVGGVTAVGTVLALVGVGALGTVVSGEARLTWAFLLADVPLALAGGAAGALASRAARGRPAWRQRAAARLRPARGTTGT